MPKIKPWLEIEFTRAEIDAWLKDYAYKVLQDAGFTPRGDWGIQYIDLHQGAVVDFNHAVVKLRVDDRAFVDEDKEESPSGESFIIPDTPPIRVDGYKSDRPERAIDIQGERDQIFGDPEAQKKRSPEPLGGEVSDEN